MLELVDTHCHLDFNSFDEDRAAAIERALEAGVRRIIIPGLDIQSSRAAIELSEDDYGIFAAVGYHPNGLDSKPDLQQTISELRGLAQHSKVVAIGEIGLDYYWEKADPALQQTWLEAQLNLASDLELPVILHNRDSTEDILSTLTQWISAGLPDSLEGRPGVLHSFSADWKAAQTAFELKFKIGFTGPLTFKKAEELRSIARQAPADRILLETDAPFLAPHPLRGKRNEPSFLVHTAQMLADVRDQPLETIALQTTQNAEELFGSRLAR